MALTGDGLEITFSDTDFPLKSIGELREISNNQNIELRLRFNALNEIVNRILDTKVMVKVT